MKNFSYNRQPSVLNVLKEPPKQKKKFNMDRMIFIGILCLLAFLLLRYLIVKWAFIQVDGQISLEKLNVNFTNDIRLKELFSMEGAAVHSGDTLFSYVNNSYQESAVIDRQIKVTAQNHKNLENLEFEIKSLRIELKREQRQLDLLQNEHEKAKKWVLLDLITLDELDKIRANIKKTELDCWQLKEEIQLLQQERTHLNFTDKNRAANSVLSPRRTDLSYYIAPIEGLIGRINFSPNEVCYETQSLLTIHNTEKVNIKAYFNQEALTDLNRGTQVEIEFPDGSVSDGFISNIAIATYELPSEFQKKYEPTQRSLLATVEPQNMNDLDLWKRFYKMNVKVSINRYF